MAKTLLERYGKLKNLSVQHLWEGPLLGAGMSKAARAADVEQSDREYILRRQQREKEKAAKEKAAKDLKESDVPAPKQPTEVDRIRLAQKQEKIMLAKRQASQLLGAQSRELQKKSREQMQKATAPKKSS